MANYKLIFKQSIKKDLRALPNKDVQKILSCINLLATNPFPASAKKLKGEEKYRLRQGNYRILYEVQKNLLIITVVKIGHRKDIYNK